MPSAEMCTWHDCTAEPVQKIGPDIRLCALHHRWFMEAAAKGGEEKRRAELLARGHCLKRCDVSPDGRVFVCY